jgi:hypothetical protein
MRRRCLQGLKPIAHWRLMSDLKVRPPKLREFLGGC